MTSDAARELAEARFRSADLIATMLAPPAGYHYARASAGYLARKTIVRIGGAAVHKDTTGAKPVYHVVDAASGYSFASFRRVGRANGFCAAIGERIESYWQRAAAGDARAGTTIARISRIHSARDKG